MPRSRYANVALRSPMNWPRAESPIIERAENTPKEALHEQARHETERGVRSAAPADDLFLRRTPPGRADPRLYAQGHRARGQHAVASHAGGPDPRQGGAGGGHVAVHQSLSR